MRIDVFYELFENDGTCEVQWKQELEHMKQFDVSVLQSAVWLPHVSQNCALQDYVPVAEHEREAH